MLIKVVGIGICGIVVLLITTSILHHTYFKVRQKHIEPYGKLVCLEDGHMHVYSMGQGSKKIILLPGLGIGLPSADFSPLMRELSDTYTVVCVEYFGVGFSSETSKSRTTDNYVEEIRVALEKAGFTPPYILMPHSISGVFSEYYAAKYPEEVEAIISLDSTSTAHYEKMPKMVNALLPVAKAQQWLGLTSILALLTVKKVDLISNGYTTKEINDSLIYVGFSVNNTVLEQISNSAEFIKQTLGTTFPKTKPYLKLISKQTFEMDNPQLKQKGLSPQEYQMMHLNRIGEHAEYQILNGSHFIYLNNAKKIADLTNEFLKNRVYDGDGLIKNE